MGIEFSNTPITWEEQGSTPSEELRKNGFQAGYKPSASTFNALLNNTSVCLQELQSKTSNLDDVKVDKVSGKGLTTNDYTDSEKAKLASKPGKKLENTTIIPSMNNTVIAQSGAEIFNDYRERTFDVEGLILSGNVASGEYSHAEGSKTTATGAQSHAEGYRTEASDNSSHAEGEYSKASGFASHAEGKNTTASGFCSHAEGENTTASSNQAHAEGYRTEASGMHSHAEGYVTTASGTCSHAEGSLCEANGNTSHAEGQGSKSVGANSHAEGYMTQAIENASHAEGFESLAHGFASHAGGEGCQAGGRAAHASGRGTYANQYQFVCGKFNKDSYAGPTSETDTSGSIFMVGGGVSGGDRRNALRTTTDGKSYGLQSFGSSGADFAEMFEIEDGNPNNEDYRGYFVTVTENGKIRKAIAEDNYILGAVSSVPTICGDVQSEMWQGQYLTDVFGEKIVETVEVEETVDEFENVIPAHTEKRWILNPEYDPSQKYISREDRPEWVAVGLIGKLIVIDDGTCKVGGYCKVTDQGTATQAENGWKVLKRIDDTHIQILYR